MRGCFILGFSLKLTFLSLDTLMYSYFLVLFFFVEHPILVEWTSNLFFLSHSERLELTFFYYQLLQCQSLPPYSFIKKALVGDLCTHFVSSVTGVSVAGHGSRLRRYVYYSLTRQPFPIHFNHF